MKRILSSFFRKRVGEADWWWKQNEWVGKLELTINTHFVANYCLWCGRIFRERKTYDPSFFLNQISFRKVLVKISNIFLGRAVCLFPERLVKIESSFFLRMWIIEWKVFVKFFIKCFYLERRKIIIIKSIFIQFVVEEKLRFTSHNCKLN